MDKTKNNSTIEIIQFSFFNKSLVYFIWDLDLNCFCTSLLKNLFAHILIIYFASCSIIDFETLNSHLANFFKLMYINSLLLPFKLNYNTTEEEKNHWTFLFKRSASFRQNICHDFDKIMTEHHKKGAIIRNSFVQISVSYFPETSFWKDRINT